MCCVLTLEPIVNEGANQDYDTVYLMGNNLSWWIIFYYLVMW